MGRDLLVQIAGDETQLNRALDRAEARLGKYGASVVAQADAQSAAYQKIGQGSAFAAGQADQYAISQEAATRRVKSGLSDMLASHSHTMQSIGDSTVAAGRKISSAGTSILSVVAPLDLAGAAAGKLEVDFSKAMEQLHTQAGYSQKSVESLSEAVLKLSPKVGASPDELAEGLYHVASAGIPASKAMEVLTSAAEGARLGGANLNDTAYALVSVFKSMPKDVKSASDAMAIMNAIVGEGDLHMQDLVEALSTGVVPAAKGAGLGLRDVGAALDILTQRGIPAEQAGTRLRQTFAFMEKSSASAQKALESIGITQNELGEDMHKPDGLLVAVEDLKKHLDDSGKSAVEQNRTLLAAFGGGRSAAAIQVLVQNVGDLNDQYKKLPEATQAVERFGSAWATFQQTDPQKLARDQQEVNTALIELGKDVLPAALPVIKDVAGAVGELAHDFEGLSTGQKQAIVDFALIATASGLVAKPIGALLSTVGLLEKGYAGATAAAGKFAGVFGTSLDETVPAAAIAGADAGNAYGTAFAAAASRGTAEVSVAGVAGGRGFAPYAIPGIGESKVPGFGERAGVPGLGPVGFTAAEQSAIPQYGIAGLPSPSEIYAQANAVSIAEKLAASAKTLAGNALKGGVIAGGGVLASQLAGQLVGGKAGSDISSIGSGAAIGAGIGTVIAPGLGTAIGAGLGSVPGVIKALEGESGLERLAHTAKDGLPNYGSDGNKRIEDAVRSIRKKEEGELAKLQPAGHGRNPGETAAEARLSGRPVLSGRTPYEEGQAQTIKDKAGYGEGQVLGSQEANYIKSGAELPNLGRILDTVSAKFKTLGPAARDGMYNAMLGMVKELEKQGRLPQGATQKFIDTLHRQFNTLGTYSKEAAAKTVAEWDLMKKGGTALKSANEFVGQILGAQKQIPLSARTTEEEAGKFFTAGEAELLNIVKHSSGERQKLAKQAYDELRGMDKSYYEAQNAEAASKLASLNALTSSLSKKGSKAFLSEWQSIEKPLTELWEAGYVTTKEYTDKMNELVEGELSSLGVKPNAVGKKAANFGAGPGSSNGLVSGLPGGVGHARGDFVGLPGERGHDDVPIWVGRGEAIVNHSQQPYVEIGLAASKAMGVQPYGSLHELYAHEKTPHSMASGGIVAPHVSVSGSVGAIAQGSLDLEARAANRVLNALRPSEAHSATVTAAGGAPTGGGYSPSQAGHFDGISVADWIIPELQYGRVHGWSGPLTSGIRLGFDPHAPDGSEHALDIYPGGAVDFGGMVDPAALANRAAFIKATAGYTGKRLLTPIGFRDDGHMSGTGHALGGYAFAAGGLVTGGATPQAEVGSIWKALSGRGALRPGAQEPSVVVFPGEGNDFVDPEHRGVVHLSNLARFLLTDPKPENARERVAIDNAHRDVVHELAHTMQQGLHTHWEAEGGAQAWADEWSPRIFGGGYQNHGDYNYSAYVDRVRNVKGADWINKGQFGYAKGGFAGAPGMAGGGFVATAYGPPWEGEEGTGTTATGVDLSKAPHRYIVAVDPSVIPLHSKLKIWPNPFGYRGDFEAEDTGGAIKGNRIDFYDWEGRKAQDAWGRQSVTVTPGGSAVAATTDSAGEAAKLEGQLDKLKREKLNLPTPASGKAGAGTRASDTAVRKRIANEELTIHEKLKRLPKKAPSGLHLSSRQEATVDQYLGAAAGDKAGRVQLATEAEDVGGYLATAQARWAAQPADLKTTAGEGTAEARATQAVISNKDVLKYYQRELTLLQKEAKQWTKLRDYYRHLARRVHGTAKKQALDKAASYQAKITTAQSDAKTLKGSIYTQETTVIEAETAAGAIPGEAAAQQQQAADEATQAHEATLSNDLGDYQASNSKVDLEQRAGLLTPEQAKAAKEGNAQKALAGGFGELTEEAILQVKGDLKELSEATQEATSALEAHTNALKESAKALNEFLNAANALALVENGSILKSMADLVSGQIAGVGYAGRRLTPGSGTAATY